ncbi:MAG: T9SS type A sorting domain-containing protein [Bacteroidota bacterium]
MKYPFTLLLILLVSLSPIRGQISWVAQSEEDPNATSSKGTASSHDVALGTNGEVYLFGNMRGNSRFDPIQFVEDGFNSMFLAKYLADGTVDWVKNLKGNGNNQAWAIAANDSQHVYIAGEYKQTNALTILNLEGYTLPGNGSESGFLAKIDDAGTVLWAKSLLAVPPPGNRQQVIPADIQVGPLGNVYMLGNIVDSVLIDSIWYNRVSPANPMMFIAKFSPAGDLIWFKHSKVVGQMESGFIIPAHMAIGSEGQLYVNGDFLAIPGLLDHLVWDGDTIPTLFSGGQFLARFTAEGVLEWWEGSEGGGSNHEPHELGIDADDNIYLTIKKGGQLTFSDGTIDPNAYKGNVLLMKYDAQGQRKFLVDVAHGENQPSSDIRDGSITLHTRPNGTTFMTGSYASLTGSYIVFGRRDTFPMPNLSIDGRRQFIAAFDAQGNYIDVGFLVDDYPTAPDYFYENTAMLSDPAGNFYLTGKFAGTLGLGSNTFTTPSGGSAGGQAFIIKFNPEGFMDLSSTGIEDQLLSSDAFSIYPNPAHDHLWLKPSVDMAGNSYHFTLLNAEGRVVAKQRELFGTYHWQISDLSPGFYTLLIQVKDQFLTRKIVIQ